MFLNITHSYNITPTYVADGVPTLVRVWGCPIIFPERDYKQVTVTEKRKWYTLDYATKRLIKLYLILLVTFCISLLAYLMYFMTSHYDVGITASLLTIAAGIPLIGIGIYRYHTVGKWKLHRPTTVVISVISYISLIPFMMNFWISSAVYIFISGLYAIPVGSVFMKSRKKG